MPDNERHAPLELIVAANLGALIRHWKLNPTSAAKQCKMHQQQMARILAMKHSITLETLSRLARGFDLEPYQLLIQDLNPSKPQAVRHLTPEDEVVLDALRQARGKPSPYQ